MARGVERLFPIQAATFAPLSAGRDLIGRARTGTGKTLAFSLPLIEKLIRVRPCLVVGALLDCAHAPSPRRRTQPEAPPAAAARRACW